MGLQSQRLRSVPSPWFALGIQPHDSLPAVFKRNRHCLCSPHSDVSVIFLRLVLTVITFWTPTPRSNIPTLSTIPQVILYRRFKPWSLVLWLDEFRAAQTAMARITLSRIDLSIRQFKNHRKNTLSVFLLTAWMKTQKDGFSCRTWKIIIMLEGKTDIQKYR